MNAQSKHISQIALPGIDPQATDSTENGTGTNSDYLEKLKALVDEKVETNPSEYGIENDYVRYRFCFGARRTLGKTGELTLEELDYCFPEYKDDNAAYLQSRPETKESSDNESPQSSAPTHPPTRQQVEQRLNNPSQSKDDSDKPKLSKKDWEWIEKANHPLGGGLFYGGGVTPQFMELDLKLGISDSPHRRRLLDYLGIHCDLKKGITSEVTVGELSDKLQCGKDKIRESIKWLVKKEVLEYSNGYAYPKHYTTGVVFVLPFVRESYEVKAKANGLRTKTGIPYRELWERREEFGFGVKCEVNAKA